MNIVFFGSSDYSIIAAQKLHKIFGLSLIVTIPDRLIGRKQILTPSPVKLFALEQNIPVITPGKLTDEVIEQIKTFSPLPPDFLIVDDYGLILPKKLLAVPAYAPLNIHHSLLPKYRGSSPAQSVILSGEEKTGVSIIMMNEKVDAGDILAQKEYVMKPDETTDSLLTQLNHLGAEIIISVIKDFNKYYNKRTIQNETQATYTKMLNKSDGYFSNDQRLTTNDRLHRMIRAYHPWPGVWTTIRIKNKELRIKILPENKMQPEGRKPMSVKDFLNGYPETTEFIKRLQLL